MPHSSIPRELLTKADLNDLLIRLPLVISNIDNLIDDLKQAF